MDYSNMSPEQLVAELNKRDDTIAKQESAIISSKKNWGKNDDQWSQGISQEQIDAIVESRLAKDKFYSAHNDSLSDEQRTDIEKYVSENNLSYDQAHSLVVWADPATYNKANTNNAWVGGENNNWSQGGAFAGKIGYSEYSKMSQAEQDSYDSFATVKFGWVTFETGSESEY